jgi:hypothetical protein
VEKFRATNPAAAARGQVMIDNNKLQRNRMCEFERGNPGRQGAKVESRHFLTALSPGKPRPLTEWQRAPANSRSSIAFAGESAQRAGFV